MASAQQTKYTLDESRLPEAWYNLAADLPVPPPQVQWLAPGELPLLLALVGEHLGYSRPRFRTDHTLPPDPAGGILAARRAAATGVC